MATLVASHLPHEALEKATRTRGHRFGALLTGGLALFAVTLHGYHPYAEDGGLYLAGVKHRLDPTLYPQATGFVLEPTRFSAFAATVAGIIRAFHSAGSPDMILLALHTASLWALLFSAWMLAARCWPTRSQQAGAVSLLACWLGLPVAGTALLIMDPYLTARSVSTPCMVLALVGALDATAPTNSFNQRSRHRGLLLSLAALILAATMHPLMAAYAAGAWLTLLAVRAPQPWSRVAGVAGLWAAALLLATALQSAPDRGGIAYAHIALTRTYWFLSEWQWYELIGIAAPVAILAGFAWWRRPDPSRSVERALTQTAISCGALATLVSILFVRPATVTHLIARLQPMRELQIVYIVLALILGAWLGRSILKSSQLRWCVALLLLGAPMLFAAHEAYPNSPHLELSGAAPQNPWVQAFLWIRDHTPKDALFALDPDYIHASGEDAHCFRAIAERSALPDYSKDGGETAIAPELTQPWVEGQAAQRNLATESDAERIAALKPLGVTWFVLPESAETSLTCPYTNERVRVCRLQ